LGEHITDEGAVTLGSLSMDDCKLGRLIIEVKDGRHKNDAVEAHQGNQQDAMTPS
jgi:hypothetical protein